MEGGGGGLMNSSIAPNRDRVANQLGHRDVTSSYPGNSSKLRASLFVTLRWSSPPGQINSSAKLISTVPRPPDPPPRLPPPLHPRTNLKNARWTRTVRPHSALIPRERSVPVSLDQLLLLSVYTIMTGWPYINNFVLMSIWAEVSWASVCSLISPLKHENYLDEALLRFVWMGMMWTRHVCIQKRSNL